MATIVLIWLFFIFCGTLACLIAVDGHPARPHYEEDAKIAVGTFASVTLSPLILVGALFAFLVAIPAIVAAPFVLAEARQGT